MFDHWRKAAKTDTNRASMSLKIIGGDFLVMLKVNYSEIKISFVLLKSVIK